MKILTKKKQKRLMFDLIDIFLMGSDALKAVGTRQPMDPAQALQRQMKMIDAAMDAANIIRGFYGNQLLMEADKQWQQLEQQHGFPLKLKDELSRQTGFLRPDGSKRQSRAAADSEPSSPEHLRSARSQRAKKTNT